MNINEILNYLQRIDYTWLKGQDLGLLAILIAIFIYYKSIPRKKIFYAIESECLITNYKSIYGRIKILHDDIEEVENLTVTKISLWNSGNIVINKNDIASKEPFEICFHSDINILETDIIYCSDFSNVIKIDKNYIKDNKIKIDFEFLDKKDGAIIQILHDGIDDKKIFTKGKIKGGNFIKNVNDKGFDISLDKEKMHGFLKIISTKKAESNFTFYILLFCCLYAIASIVYKKSAFFEFQTGNETYQTLSVIILCCFTIWLIIRYFKSIIDQVPNKLYNNRYIDNVGNENMGEIKI